MTSLPPPDDGSTGPPPASPRPDDGLPTTEAVSAETGPWVGAAPHPQPEGGRFRIVRFYRGGGLGDVYIAIDVELDREVALKEIRPALADEPDKRARFVFEAEVTGGLEHPGIVPVYGRGQYDDGRPFYAMRFIRGETLHEAIARFHRGDVPARDPAQRSLALRELLGRFLDVCDAVEYAHHRGVLHRDLKPGNVLLGRFGETFVGDWGLARLIARAGDPESGTGADEPTLRPPSTSGTGPTLSGSVVGTVGFMAPEQAAGRLEQVGPAADVYSLGAILYTILAGQPSMRSGDDRAEVLANIEAGVFPRPRSINPSAPAPLEAICLKAMALEPADRHASPHALAREIKNWLADEPVTAYQEPWNERLARWARRHRTRVQAAVLSLTALALVSSVAAVAVTRSYRREQQAHARSEADFGTARASVSELYHAASRDVATLPNSEAVRERLALQVVEAYERLLKARPTDRAVRRDAARADRELANIRRLLGAHEPARKDYDRAVTRLRALLAELPDETEANDDMALTLTDLASMEHIRGRPGPARQALDEALDRAAKLSARAPQDLRPMRTEAFARIVLGRVQLDTGQFLEARRSSEQASKLWSLLAASPRAMPLFDPVFAVRARALLASVLEELGEQELARKELQTAYDAAAARADENPGNSDTLVLFAEVRSALGDMITKQEPVQAISLFQGSIKDLLLVRRNRPRVPAFRAGLARAYRGLGGAQLAAGEAASARRATSQAKTLYRALITEFGLPSYHYGLGRTLALEAQIALAQGQPVEARGLLNAAIEAHARALQLNPESAFDQRHILRCRAELGALPSALPAAGEGGPKPAANR
jgi:serine/threonine-protein kinase